MPFSVAQRTEFEAAVHSLRETLPGREATMYQPISDLLVDVLGYHRRNIDIDTTGPRGRPDLTVYAPGGAAGKRVPWIVVEAKDEPGAAANPRRRLMLYGDKAKYITADTAFIVMIDPTMIVARGAAIGTADTADIEIPLAGIGLEDFAERLAPLRSEIAGVPHALERFREGDESLIAFDRLSAPLPADPDTLLAVQVARNVFLDSLTETTKHLQGAVARALDATRDERADILGLVAAFEAEFGRAVFRSYPISIEGSNERGREKDALHRTAAAKLRRDFSRRPALTRLTLETLPRFAERVGLDLGTEQRKIERYFSNETANLILARILLIRFLEDHGFFDYTTPDGPVRRRYLCNGGVAAFQGMREYFGQGYTRLLEEAYRIGGSFYSAAFDESEMDWVFALSDPDLSRNVEWAMFRMARFDFVTARGDLLTGVYERFLDRKQRKDQGEYYTPPSIARYVLDRLRALGLSDTDDILDPACGSGTFLIERYRQVVGDAADAGLADYAEGRVAIEHLHGNDLNPFSAIVTQIQMLWHLLAFGVSVKTTGFPDLRVSERANSLVPVNLLDPTQTRFGEIDRTGYGAVAGNPPYIRPERGANLEEHAQQWFEAPRKIGARVFSGMPVGRNAYPLFIYRALDHWCRQPTEGDERPAGLLGFVIPLSFCGSRETAPLRNLFQVGGRWTIREIVDMELIWRDVFDADVLPMVLIAEARPATEEDKVAVRIADESCVHKEEGARKSIFRLDALPEFSIRYSDIIAPDGAVLTRLTTARTAILRKLWACSQLKDAALTFWYRRSPATGTTATTLEPTGYGASKWTKDVLIKDGARLRGKVVLVDCGLDVFKGENITACRFAGNPLYRGLDISQASAPSIWAYKNILPEVMYALPTIERVPVAAPFNPHKTAVLNTCSVFAPRADLVHVPFDVVLLSRVYSWFYVLAGRRSFLNLLRSHIYPTSIMALPWSEAIAARSTELTLLRHELLTACQRRFDQQTAMRSAADALGMQDMRTVARARTGVKISKSVELTEDNEFLLDVGEIEDGEGEWTLPIGGGGEAITVNDREFAELTREGLTLSNGTLTKWGGVLRTTIPSSPEMAEQLREIIADFNPAALEERVEEKVDAIDAIVGPCLGLSEDDVTTIQTQMSTDPFLSRAVPRYPYFQPQQRGRRLSLESASRYSSAPV